MQRTSVAFVDDHPVLLEGLVANFSARADYAVVGIGSCAGDALTVATRQRPDVMVIDLNMPGDPFEVIAKITQFSPAKKCSPSPLLQASIMRFVHWRRE